MISERMDANQIKQIKITVRNNTPTAAADLKLKTNLKPDQFSAVIPKSIPPQGQAQILLNLNGRALFDATLDGIGFEINYELVKTI